MRTDPRAAFAFGILWGAGIFMWGYFTVDAIVWAVRIGPDLGTVVIVLIDVALIVSAAAYWRDLQA